ncbi:MAG TPA: phosphoribosylpyrophosphate synthetase, partial [Candidatus Polarisedimenticolia bacterium]|nr:phosphoribosylpyrophosphate synthetase [Candidatus Polarisedimenticolia bacterium]
HAVLSGPAVDRIRKMEMAQTVVTNSIPLDPARAKAGRVTVLSVAGLLSEAIRRIHTNSSVSSLFV